VQQFNGNRQKQSTTQRCCWRRLKMTSKRVIVLLGTAFMQTRTTRHKTEIMHHPGTCRCRGYGTNATTFRVPRRQKWKMMSRNANSFLARDHASQASSSRLFAYSRTARRDATRRNQTKLTILSMSIDCKECCKERVLLKIIVACVNKKRRDDFCEKKRAAVTNDTSKKKNRK
jgi:hypothetical protein